MQASSLINKQISRKSNVLMRSGLNNTIDEATAPFAKSFFKRLIIEAEEPMAGTEPGSVEDFTPDRNKADYEASLGDTPPEQFKDPEGVSPTITGEDLSKLKHFVEKLDEFASFLNDYESGQSVHSVLSNNDKAGSILKGVSRKASDSITRIAGEISKLKEVLASFVIEAPRKLRDASQNQIGAVQ